MLPFLVIVVTEFGCGGKQSVMTSWCTSTCRCPVVCLSVCLCFHVSELQMGAKRAIGLFSLVATTESLYMWRATAYLAGRSCCGCVNRKELHGELHARSPPGRMLPWLGSVFRVLGVWGLSGLGSPQTLTLTS